MMIEGRRIMSGLMSCVSVGELAAGVVAALPDMVFRQGSELPAPNGVVIDFVYAHATEPLVCELRHDSLCTTATQSTKGASQQP